METQTMATEVYLLFEVKECSDHYYDPYHILRGMYTAREDAIALADAFVTQAKTENQQCLYYVQKRNVLSSRDDKEVQEKCYEVMNKIDFSKCDHTYDDYDYDNMYS